MLDNWTEAEFWQAVSETKGIENGLGTLEQMADFYGRIAITDNEKLERIWDKFVQSYDELKGLNPNG